MSTEEGKPGCGDPMPYVRPTCKSDLPGYDFKTSTGIGLRFIPSIQQYVQDKPAFIPAELRGRDPLLENLSYTPVISGDMDWKIPEPTDRFEKLSCNSMLYIKRYGEKAKAHPPNPQRPTFSEFQDEYTRKDIPQRCLVDLRQQCICRAKPDTSQSPTAAGFENEGVTRLLDPYNTTTQLTHHYMYQRDADFYKRKPADMTPILSPRITPIYDKMKFKNACFNHSVYRPVRFVPHSALTSETKASFGHPLTKSDLVTFDNEVEFPAAPHIASKGEILSTPAMYCTEYTHIAESWPVNACVQYGNREVELILCEG